MALRAFPGTLQFKTCDLFGNGSSNFIPVKSRIVHIRPWVIEARARTRVESPKVRNRRLQKKYNGTQKKPRLSVFCSEKQLYAMLVDDQNKKCLFYGSTLQQSIRSTPDCTTVVSTSIRVYRKQHNVSVKSLLRHVLIWELMKYRLMIVMVSPGERGWKHLRLHYLVMGFCFDRLSSQLDYF
ncbi:hypothetical protein OSB04_006971 [Centaurea solstitialis]|uniref:Uncharacterized protein n=1 Tax=Centaurea solstitialis TaxID=347529 RepID=A0AA38TWT6_9ASTR|nr:hypothetical protein OSB04_006971 [Centaurea solstitialis]